MVGTVPHASQAGARRPRPRERHARARQPGSALTTAPGRAGAREYPTGLEELGCRSLISEPQEGHLEGAARWPQREGRGHDRRHWFGLARGALLLAEVADKLGLTRALSRRLGVLKQRRRGHDPGRVIRELAVMAADAGSASHTNPLSR